MAKVLCSTGSLIGRPNGRDYRLLESFSKELKCDGFEFMMYTDWYEKIPDIIAMVRGSGISVPAYHAQKSIGENISKGGHDELEDAFRRFTQNAEMAAALGAEKMVIHLWDGITSDNNIKSNLKAYAEIRKIADANGLMLLVENVVCNCADPYTHWMELLERYPDVKFIFDTKMAAFHNQLDMLYEDRNAFLWQQGHICHYHVNDYAGGYMDWANLRTLLLGRGKLDFDRFFSFIRKIGYDDTFTLEGTAFDATGSVDFEALNAEVDFVRSRLYSLRERKP